MKTLKITEARKNLGHWLKAAARGEDIGIICGADIIGLRKMRVRAAGEDRLPGNLPHPAIGLWKDRVKDGLTYQKRIRAEWDKR